MAVPLNPNRESSTTTRPSPDKATGQQTNDSETEPQPGCSGAGDGQVANELTSASPEEPGTSNPGSSASSPPKTQEESPTENLPVTQKPPEMALENALEKVENALGKVAKVLEKAVEKASEKEQPTDSEAWGSTVTYYEKMDGAMIEGYHAEIDSLLIFAGLFSAILTAFIIQSYQLLQQDSAGISASILANISLQIAAIQSGQQSIQPSTNSLDTFPTSRSAVALNVLWFLSLVFSLASAFFGILIKQGLREYLKWMEVSSPRDTVRVRQVRFEAFVKWNVSGIVGALPVLLEIGVVFFMCGLLVLLWTLHRVVAIIITIPVALFLLTSATVMLLPVFSDSCPFKSPVALSILSGIAWVGHHILHENSVALARTTWKDRDLAASGASEKSLLLRSVLGFYSSPTDDKVQQNAELRLRALISQPPKKMESIDYPSKDQQDCQLRKVLLPWSDDGLADLVENILDCDKSAFSTFCKHTYGSDNIQWQAAVSSFGTTRPSTVKKVSEQVLQKIQRLPPKLVIALSNIIIEDLYNVFNSGAEDLITQQRKTLIFACCFLCSLQFASIPDDDYIKLVESQIHFLQQMFKKAPLQTFLQQNPEEIPIQNLFAWLVSAETSWSFIFNSGRRSLSKPICAPAFLTFECALSALSALSARLAVQSAVSMIFLHSAIKIGTRRGDDPRLQAGAIMALSMRGLEGARYSNPFSSLDEAQIPEVVPKSIRLIEDTMKLSVFHGIVNCGTPSLKMLGYLIHFSQHTDPTAKESILLGIHRGIFTWSIRNESLSLGSLLEAYHVDARERVECAKLQKIFIHGGPLPKGWTAHWRPDRPYCVDHNSRSTTWMDPRSDSQSHDDPCAMRDGWLEFAEDDNGPVAGFDGWEKRSYTPVDDAGYFYFVQEDGKKTRIDPRHADDVEVQARWQSEGNPPSYDESAQITESSKPTATLGPSTGDVGNIGSDDALNSGGTLPPQDSRTEHNACLPGIREDNLHGQENAPHTSVDMRRVDFDSVHQALNSYYRL